MTFLACSGFIVWAHSCDTRILGVQPKAVIQESLVAKRSHTETSSFRQQYIRQFVSAAAFTMVGNNPQLYLASFRYLRQHNYFSTKKDSMSIRLQPLFDAHN